MIAPVPFFRGFPLGNKAQIVVVQACPGNLQREKTVTIPITATMRTGCLNSFGKTIKPGFFSSFIIVPLETIPIGGEKSSAAKILADQGVFRPVL
jgi:hypothetical protein